MSKHFTFRLGFFGSCAVVMTLLMTLGILLPDTTKSQAQNTASADLLGATYVAPDGLFAIAYPTGGDWRVSGQADHSVTFLNQPIYGTLVPGQGRITISIIMNEQHNLQAMAESRLNNGYRLWPTQPDDPVSLTLGGREALSYTMSSGGFADASHLLIIDLGEGWFASVHVFAMGGELARFVAVAHVMASTLSVWLPVELEDGVALEIDKHILTETYSSEDGTITFNYPAGWVVESGANRLVVASHDDYNFPVHETGEVIAVMHTLSNVDTIDPVALLARETRVLDKLRQPIIAFTLAGYPAARTVYVNESFSVYNMVGRVDDDFGLGIVAFAAPDSIVQLEPVLLAIASTVRVSSTHSTP